MVNICTLCYAFPSSKNVWVICCNRWCSAEVEYFSDFFDSEVEPTEAETAHSKKMSEILPEGFFDDPKLDAKVGLIIHWDYLLWT